MVLAQHRMVFRQKLVGLSCKACISLHQVRHWSVTLVKDVITEKSLAGVVLVAEGDLVAGVESLLLVLLHLRLDPGGELLLRLLLLVQDRRGGGVL